MNWEKGLIQRAGMKGFKVRKPWAKHLVWQMHAVHDGCEAGRFGDGVYVTVARVNPAMAELMTQDMMANRRVKAHGIAKLARQLKRGLWMFNAVPMLFNRQAQLGDGQHRARACAVTRVEFDTVLVVGVSEDAIKKTVDSGVVRNAADRLAIMEHRNATTLAATCRLVHCYLVDDYTFRASRGAVSDQELMELAATDARILECVDDTRAEKGWSGILAPSVASFVRYLLRATDEADSESFMFQLRTGAGIPDEADPVHMLRRQIVNRKMRKQRMTPEIMIPLCIKAWNLYREGVGQKHIRADGKFPVPA